MKHTFEIEQPRRSTAKGEVEAEQCFRRQKTTASDFQRLAENVLGANAERSEGFALERLELRSTHEYH